MLARLRPTCWRFGRESTAHVAVDVTAFVSATPKEVWSVFTDYQNAARFISNLEQSAVLSRSDDMFVIWQKGKTRLGPFSVESINA